MEEKRVNSKVNEAVSENIELLKRLFPSVVKDGEIDITALKQELGQYEDSPNEKYEMIWTGKKQAKITAQEDASGKCLKFMPELSKNADKTRNIYIQGDNLEALKLLQKNYYSAIKLIYIDPPYNTGNDFVYNDSFVIDKDESDYTEGNMDELGGRYTVNSKSGNRYHANWLNMIYPRLKLARNLLSDDGVIFISIDEKERDNLVKVCNEIYGEDNFVGAIIVKSNPRGSMSSAELANLHEYIVVYAKSRPDLNLIGHRLTDDMAAEYKYEDNQGKYRLLGLRMRGGFWRRSERPNLYFPIFVNPNDRSVSLTQNDKYSVEVVPVQPSTNEDGTWRWSKDKIEANKELLIGTEVKRDGQMVWDISQKDYFERGIERRTKAKTIWDEKEINYQNGTEEIKKLLGSSGIFDYSKPVFLISQILNMVDLVEGDVVLDFFSGSATTAQAVMEYCIKEKKIEYILMQLPEKCPPNSEASRKGYMTICDIGRKRIDAAGEMLIKQNPESTGTVDVGFKVFEIANTNIKWNSLIAAGQLDLRQIESTPDLMDFMPGVNDIDVVYELMLRQRDISLAEKIEKLCDIGERTYLYANSFLICLETEITTSMIDKLAAIDPVPVKYVFRDSAFKDDIALKDETFRRLKAVIEKNTNQAKQTYTVEFI